MSFARATAILCGLAALGILGGAAEAGGVGGFKAFPAASADGLIVPVSKRHRHYRAYRDDDYDDDDYYVDDRGYYAYGRVVEAPFTRVERRRRVAVDAPFASVRVGRRGTWVRAPFVDLYVPRR